MDFLLNKDKLEKLKSINNDDSDLIIKFDEYVEPDNTSTSV